MLEYRPVLYRAADALDRTAARAKIADSLYAELYGIRIDAAAERQSLFRYFQGRSSLATWLRAVLAQRYVDRLRAQRRLEPLPDDTTLARRRPPGCPARRAAGRARSRRGRYLALVRQALAAASSARSQPRDRLRLACYYVQELTLAETGRLLQEHEATVSRQLARTRRAIRTEVERELAPAGLNRPQIAECFSSSPRIPGPLDLRPLFREAAPRSGAGTLAMTNSFDRLLRESLEPRRRGRSWRGVSRRRDWPPWCDGTLSTRRARGRRSARGRVLAVPGADGRDGAHRSALPAPWWRSPACGGWCRSRSPPRRRSSLGRRAPHRDAMCPVGGRPPRASSRRSQLRTRCRGQRQRSRESAGWSGRRSRSASPRRPRPRAAREESAERAARPRCEGDSDLPMEAPHPSASAPPRPASSRRGNRLRHRGRAEAPPPGDCQCVARCGASRRARRCRAAPRPPQRSRTRLRMPPPDSRAAAWPKRWRSTLRRARRRARAADSVARPFRALADRRAGSGRAFDRQRRDVADADDGVNAVLTAGSRLVERLLAGGKGAVSC